jgi:UrcA family protein
MNRFFIPAIALLSLTAIVPAAAGPIDPSRVVTYHDLNLVTPAGQAALRARIARAVNAVCGDIINDRSLQFGAEMRKCRKQTAAENAPKVALAIDRAERLAARAGMDQIAGR